MSLWDIHATIEINVYTILLKWISMVLWKNHQPRNPLILGYPSKYNIHYYINIYMQTLYKSHRNEWGVTYAMYIPFFKCHCFHGNNK